jgi:ABC-type glycerol-3-phosphate transport system substrate-binding protein
MDPQALAPKATPLIKEKSMKRHASIAIISAGLLALAACSSTASVSQSDVESEISAQWEAQNGAPPEDVTCPGSLEGTVGTTMKCDITSGELILPVNVTVTSVDGSKVNFDIQSE